MKSNQDLFAKGLATYTKVINARGRRQLDFVGGEMIRRPTRAEESIRHRADPGHAGWWSQRLSTVVTAGRVEAEETASPGIGSMISQVTKSRNTHSAVFVEARVDEELGQVRITRVVIAVAAGRIINPKRPAARSSAAS